jgi:hypothetical protein
MMDEYQIVDFRRRSVLRKGHKPGGYNETMEKAVRSLECGHGRLLDNGEHTIPYRWKCDFCSRRRSRRTPENESISTASFFV